MPSSRSTSLALLHVLAVLCSAHICLAISDTECVRFLVSHVQAKANVNFALPAADTPYDDALVEPICNEHSMILQIFNETMFKLPECSRVLSAPQGMFQIWPQCAARCESAFVNEWAKTLPAFIGVTPSASHNYDDALTAPVCENSAAIATGLEMARKRLDCKVFARIANSRWEQKCAGRCKELLKNDLATTGTNVTDLFGDSRWTEKGLAKTCTLASVIEASRTKIVQKTNPECSKHLEFFLPPANQCTVYNCRTSVLASWANLFPILGSTEDMWELELNSEQRDLLCDSKGQALEAIKTVVGEKPECEVDFYVKERMRIDSLNCPSCVDCLVDITKALSNIAPSNCDDVYKVADELDKCHSMCSGKPEPAHKTYVETVLELGNTVPNCEQNKLREAAAKYDVAESGEKKADGFDLTDSTFLIATSAGVGGFLIGAVFLRRRRRSLAKNMRTRRGTLTRAAARTNTRGTQAPVAVYTRKH